MNAPLEAELVPAEDRESRHLMVVLHGLGDSMDGYRWVAPYFNLPALNVLLVNAPDPYYGGWSWYDFDGHADAGIERSRRLLTALLDDCRNRGYPPEKTLLFGFSQGCLVTVDTGLRYPHRLGGMIGVSGYVHRPERLLSELSPVAREQRLLITHGSLDPLIPCEPSRRQFELLRQAGLQIEWHAFSKVHTIDEEGELPLIREFIARQIQA